MSITGPAKPEGTGFINKLRGYVRSEAKTPFGKINRWLVGKLLLLAEKVHLIAKQRLNEPTDTKLPPPLSDRDIIHETPKPPPPPKDLPDKVTKEESDSTFELNTLDQFLRKKMDLPVDLTLDKGKLYSVEKPIILDTQGEIIKSPKNWQAIVKERRALAFNDLMEDLKKGNLKPDDYLRKRAVINIYNLWLVHPERYAPPREVPKMRDLYSLHAKAYELFGDTNFDLLTSEKMALRIEAWSVIKKIQGESPHRWIDKLAHFRDEKVDTIENIISEDNAAYDATRFAKDRYFIEILDKYINHFDLVGMGTDITYADRIHTIDILLHDKKIRSSGDTRKYEVEKDFVQSVLPNFSPDSGGYDLEGLENLKNQMAKILEFKLKNEEKTSKRELAFRRHQLDLFDRFINDPDAFNDYIVKRKEKFKGQDLPTRTTSKKPTKRAKRINNPSAVGAPAGIPNFGNTCYINAVMQSLIPVLGIEDIPEDELRSDAILMDVKRLIDPNLPNNVRKDAVNSIQEKLGFAIGEQADSDTFINKFCRRVVADGNGKYVEHLQKTKTPRYILGQCGCKVKPKKKSYNQQDQKLKDAQLFSMPTVVDASLGTLKEQLNQQAYHDMGVEVVCDTHVEEGKQHKFLKNNHYFTNDVLVITSRFPLKTKGLQVDTEITIKGDKYQVESLLYRAGATQNAGHITAVRKKNDKWYHCDDNNIYELEDHKLQEYIRKDHFNQLYTIILKKV